MRVMRERTIRSAVITGPTGAIGTALCGLLAQNKIHVYAIVRPGSARVLPLRRMEGVEVVECDSTELRCLPEIIAAADVFYHFSWIKTTGEGRNDMDSQIRNIQFTLDACCVASALGCQVFIGAGSQAEYGRVDHALTADTPCFPENGYGMAKLCAGAMSRVECEKLGIDHIGPRFLSVYGPYDGENALIPQLVKKLLKGEKMPLTSGEQIWDYLYSGDAAEALYRLALYGKSGEIYPVGNGNARPLREYLEIIRNMIDNALPLGFGEVPYSEKQVMHLEADISALRKDTGFKPETDFETGIRQTIEYYREMNNV